MAGHYRQLQGGRLHHVQHHSGGHTRTHKNECICCTLRTCATCIIFAVSFAGILMVASGISASVMTAVYYSPVSEYITNDGLDYGYNDTRILPVSHPSTRMICESLELLLSSSIDETLTRVILFALQNPPNLTAYETFAMSDQPYITTGDNYYYYYYMHPGSAFNMSVCIMSEHENNSGFGYFYLLKGKSNFMKWLDDDYSNLIVMDNFTVIFNCSDERSDEIHAYNILEDDYYFLAYDGDDFVDIQLQVSASFYRTQYDVPEDDSIVDTCVEGYESYGYGYPCFVGVPLSGQLIYFLMISDPEEQDWARGDVIDLDISCVPRVWMYAVFASAAFIFLTAILTFVMCRIVCKCRTTPTVKANVPGYGSMSH